VLLDSNDSFCSFRGGNRFPVKGAFIFAPITFIAEQVFFHQIACIAFTFGKSGKMAATGGLAMRWTRLFLTAACMLPVLSSAASADWHDFWTRSKLDFHRNTSWPQPFQSQEREAVRSPFRIMANKGWQMEHTLADWHFQSDTQQLTKAGEMRLRYLLSVPEARRAVFVLRGATRDVTATRVDSVQQAIVRIQPEGKLPPVYESTVRPPNWPGDAVDAMNRKYYDSQPAPVLPAGGGGGGGA